MKRYYNNDIRKYRNIFLNDYYTQCTGKLFKGGLHYERGEKNQCNS